MPYFSSVLEPKLNNIDNYLQFYQIVPVYRLQSNFNAYFEIKNVKNLLIELNKQKIMRPYLQKFFIDFNKELDGILYTITSITQQNFALVYEFLHFSKKNERYVN